jgi:hypothetical protein
MKGVLFQLSDSFKQVRGMFGMPTDVLAGGSYKGRTAKERPAHPVISCMSLAGVTARHFPALNSRFASRMSFRKAARRCSIKRLDRISTNDSFCGNDNPSVNPTILSNVIPIFILVFYSVTVTESTRMRLVL